MGKEEREERSGKELEKVGLAEQKDKKPGQLSGGQMQRVAIARALVNQPDIVLADEPTGALDSDTGEQVMQLLKEVAEDRLVIMVTHNPDLANRYANRIISLKDGKVISDTNPYLPESGKDTPESDKMEADVAEASARPAAPPAAEGETNKSASPARKPSMSFLTALSLSVSNLLS